MKKKPHASTGANIKRVLAVQELRRSGAAGYVTYFKSRSAQKRRAIKESKES